MEYVMIFALCVAAYCLITNEIKYQKRKKKHDRGEFLKFL